MSSPRVELPPLARRELASGLKIVVLERRALPLVTLRLAIPAGGAHEPPERAGLSTFVARMLRRGAGRWDGASFAEELDFLGGQLGATAGFDYLWLDAEFTSDNLEQGLPLFLAALREPAFAEEEVARERERAIAEVVQARDEAEELADEAFLHYLFQGHPYGIGAAGSTSALTAIDRADVVAYHGGRLRPDGGVLVVVGDVDREGFADRLAELLSDWPASGAVPAPPAPAGRGEHDRIVLVDQPGATQVQYRTGDIGVARTTPLWHQLVVANTVFGGGFTSRLVHEVRVKRGLTYGVLSRFVPCRAPGPFSISTFTRTEAVVELHELIGSLLETYRREGPDDAELAEAKAYLAGLQPRRVETPEGLAGAVAETELFGLGLEAITEFRRDVGRVTREEAAEAARTELPGEARLTILVGDAERVRAEAEQLGDLTVVPVDFAEDAT